MHRRELLNLMSMVGGGLLLGVSSTACVAIKSRKVEQAFLDRNIFQPNAFLGIHLDGRIVLSINKSEMGQGIMTASATLVAEELEIDLNQIDVFQRFNPEFGNQMTGGSRSMHDIFLPIRRAAATAREMLRSAAAEKWGVPVEECTVKSGAVHHPSQQSKAYHELVALASQQTITKDPPLKEAKDFTLIGKGVQRVDALNKSTGRTRFGTDVDVEGKVCAYVIRPPTLGGQAKNIQDEEALNQQGVLSIFPFERGVAVIAEKFWQAQRAARLVEVTWEGGILDGFNTSDLAVASQKQSEMPGEHTNKDIGNVDDVFEVDTNKVIEMQYAFPYLSHATMEPQNCTAAVYEDRAKLWVPTQAPTICSKVASEMLNLPEENIDIDIMMLGGGFGRRASVDFVIDALHIAQRYPNVPVQVIWTREDDMSLGYYRPQGSCRMKGAVDSNGDVVGIQSHLVSQLIIPDMKTFLLGVFPSVIPPKLRQKISDATIDFVSGSSLVGVFEGGDIVATKYNLPNFRFEYTSITTKIPVMAWRSVAHSYSAFIMETFLDQLAHTGDQDPVELRRKLLTEHPRHLAVMEMVIEKGNWGMPIEDGWGRGFAMSEFADSVVAQVVEAGVVDNQIVVRHVTCAAECGLVVNPDIVRSQIESGIIYGLSMMYEKIDVVDGVIQQRNFDAFPVMRMHQSPTIETILMPSDNKPSGIGEVSLPPINAAVSNAVFAATGQRLSSMPLQDAWDNRNQSTGVVQ